MRGGTPGGPIRKAKPGGGVQAGWVAIPMPGPGHHPALALRVGGARTTRPCRHGSMPCPWHALPLCGPRPPHSLTPVVTGPLERGRWLHAALHSTDSTPSRATYLHHTLPHHCTTHPTTPVCTADWARAVAPDALAVHLPNPNTRVCVLPPSFPHLCRTLFGLP